ncbi:amidase domain-containing protein [Paenibacillus ihumii]|uniref:amidase domain-containing protein n=1 Tax=Paenibacillus ihumii TaxID=687436 RepID=UPI0006D82DB9|nr:amidase domain-containing protein [Paenibacillus ihumii]
MSDEWRRTLSLYVNQHNQDEVDYRPKSAEEGALVTDLEYLQRRGERKRRLQEWYKERRATPLRCETRARLLREIDNRPDQIEVELQLARKTYYEKGGARHQEEIIDRQRLTLEREGSGWVITRIDQPAGERHAPFKLPMEAESRGSAGKGKLPEPYLNPQVLGSRSSRSTPYRREDAVLYADRWWDGFNPEFAAFEVDCTNYISQCLFAGGAPINYTGKRETGWWYKGYIKGREAWSYSWSVANALERLLAYSKSGLRAEAVERPEQLQLGDVIIYDWDGDGSYQHSTIVTAFDAGGMPLVNAHTTPSKHRYWDYRDSYAWSENTVYRFFRIADYF